MRKLCRFLDPIMALPCTAAILLSLLALPARCAETPLLLRPARVFDAEDGRVHEGWVVLVTAERITAAGPASQVQAPANAVVMDLQGMTLLPGLMDIHSHIFLHAYSEALWDDQVLKEPVAYRSVRRPRVGHVPPPA